MKTKSTQPVIHRHIVIIPSPVEGEDWFERYQEIPPKHHLAVVATEVARTGHVGQYQIYRAPGVSERHFKQAARTLQGYIPYEHDLKHHRYLRKNRGYHGD